MVVLIAKSEHLPNYTFIIFGWGRNLLVLDDGKKNNKADKFVQILVGWKWEREKRNILFRNFTAFTEGNFHAQTKLRLNIEIGSLTWLPYKWFVHCKLCH